MTREKGTKNKPKSAAELIEQLKAQGYRVEGDKLYPPTAESEGKPPATTPQPFDLNDFLNVEPEPEPETDPVTDTFTCGNCQAKLPSALPTCPTCGASLTWS